MPLVLRAQGNSPKPHLDLSRATATNRPGAVLLCMGLFFSFLFGEASAGALQAGGDAQAADAGELERRPPDVDAQHRAEEIDLEPFDPADRHAEVTR